MIFKKGNDEYPFFQRSKGAIIMLTDKPKETLSRCLFRSQKKNDEE
jgi:hypothetical protein